MLGRVCTFAPDLVTLHTYFIVVSKSFDIKQKWRVSWSWLQDIVLLSFHVCLLTLEDDGMAQLQHFFWFPTRGGEEDG